MEIDVPLESRGDSSSNNDGVSSEVERVAKRPRLSANENEENDVGSPQESSTVFELPPEVWARVMERKLYDILHMSYMYLKFSSFVNCGVCCVYTTYRMVYKSLWCMLLCI